MFNRILKKPAINQTESVFPKVAVKQDNNSTLSETSPEKRSTALNLSKKEIRDIIKAEMIELFSEPEFVCELEDGILQNLEKKYDFTPTEVYKQQEEQKKQYIKQLDGYLEDKKNINTQITSELQSFLSQTQTSLEHALKTFTTKLNESINAAEQKYGIKEIKKQLGLDDNSDKVKG